MKSENVIEILHSKPIDREYALFVTPYCEAGDLDDWMALGRHSTCESLGFVMGLLLGLTQLHSKKLIHRDLKPANLLLKTSSKGPICVIGDFGSAIQVDDIDQLVSASRHSVLYRPPESIVTDKYSRFGDIYQAGVVMYQLLGGCLPYLEFEWLNEVQRRKYDEFLNTIDRSIFVDNILKEKIVNGKIIQEKTMHPWISNSLKKIVIKATHLDPKKRYSDTSAFFDAIRGVKSEEICWQTENSLIEGKVGGLSIRIRKIESSHVVEKKRKGEWRRVNNLNGDLNSKLFSRIRKEIFGLRN